MKNYRVYNTEKMVKIAEGYFEVPYVEYREDGTIYCEGTEDFSKERLETLKSYDVVAKTGEKTKESHINKGGRNKWEEVGAITAEERKTAMKVAEIVFAGKEIDLRKTKMVFASTNRTFKKMK